MFKSITVSLILGFMSWASPLLQAGVGSYEFTEPEMAQRFVELTTVLRCPKCQNQNLADSDSIIAKDLRGQLQMLIKTGQTDRQITDFMVQRYGEFILYNPPLNKGTLVLWLAPFGMVLLGLWALWFFGRKTPGQDAILTPKEQQQIEHLLGDNQAQHRDLKDD